MKYFLFALAQGLLMLIKQLIKLRKVRTENLKFTSDGLRPSRLSFGWLVNNTTVDDYFEVQIAQIIFR